MKTNDHLPIPNYSASEDRYNDPNYKKCGNSGLYLPALSVGLWHNFGDAADLHNARLMLRKAFDLGITHFDLANNYGPPYGSAEENFAKIYRQDFKPYRDELLISTKAGYDMWAGPYGRGGSKKYLAASCDQSLKRMGLDYVDIFYHHCPDAECPIDETADALALIVQQGKALYVGISNYYEPAKAEAMVTALKARRVPLLINQLRYSMLDRRTEKMFTTAEEQGFGIIAFSPLEQGILTGKYNKGIPTGSRASDKSSYLQNGLDQDKVKKAIALEAIAAELRIPMTTLTLSWLLRSPAVCSVLAGASTIEQIEQNQRAVTYNTFSDDVLQAIEAVLVS